MLSRSADPSVYWTLIAVGLAWGLFGRPPALAVAADTSAAAAAAASDAGGTAADGSGPRLEAARVDGESSTAEARQHANLNDGAHCSDAGDDAIIWLHPAPGRVQDYASCWPALKSVETSARSLVGSLPEEASGWPLKARESAASLFAAQPVQEAALLDDREVLRRNGNGTTDVVGIADWERSAVMRLFSNGSAIWTEPFYACSAREWRAMLSVEGGRRRLFVLVSLATCHIGQCDDPRLFLATDACDKSFTTCESALGSGFVNDSRCKCKSCKACERKDQGHGSATEETHGRPEVSSTSSFYLEICSTGSSYGNSPTSMTEHYDITRRALSVLCAACIVLCWIVMVFVMVRRDSKVIVSAKWIILEMVLVGATLMYGSVLVEYFKPNAWSCLLRPWLRELGFGCTYGALNIKTYKVLAEFRTRKARRVHVRDKDLIKYLVLVVGVMTFYMASWTATNISYMTSNVLNITRSQNDSSGRTFEICVHTAWDIVTELMELALVISGLYMSYRIRRAPSLFYESKFITSIFILECLVSGAFYVARHCALVDLGSEWLYTLSFCRTQMTVTLLLLLLLGPKLWYVFHPPGKGSPWSSEGPNTDLLGRGANINGHRGPGGDSEIVDISLKEMEPDEIWQELRRVYTQLQLLKVKVMRYENPHIHEKKHHRIRKQLYSRISRSGNHHKARQDSGGCAGAVAAATAAAAPGDDEYSHEHELLAYESGQASATPAAGNALH